MMKNRVRKDSQPGPLSSWLWLKDVGFVTGLGPVLGPSGETLTLWVSGPNACEGWQEEEQ